MNIIVNSQYLKHAIANYPLISKNTDLTDFLFYFHFIFYLKLLVSKGNFLEPENLLEVDFEKAKPDAINNEDSYQVPRL